MFNNDDAYHPEQERLLDALINGGHLEKALALLQAWHEREPWNGDVLMRLAVVHWLSGEPARTLRDLDAFLALYPDHAEALARRAQALLMLGKRNDAEESLKRAEALDPQAPGVALNRALLQEADGDFLNAVASMDAYLQAVPTDHLALARRSHLNRQLGRYEAALQDAQTCVSMQPEDPESHFAQALAHVTLEQGTEALHACDQALRLKATFLPALRLKIDLLADLGRLEQAQHFLGQLEALEPEAPHTKLLRARLATERGEFADALAWIGRYLDDYPDEPYGYYRRGMIYFHQEDYARALDDFLEYARLAPNALEAYEQQFLCYLSMAQFAEAEAVSRHALSLQPSSFRLQYNHAFALLLCGRSAEALAGFQQALALAPRHEELLLRIHQALSEHVEPDRRMAWFEQAAAVPEHRSALLLGLLADLYLEAEQFDQALRFTKDVLALDRQRPFGYLLGVKALCLLDRYDDALTLADAGLQALPEDGRLRLAHALVLRDMGRPDEALHDLELARRQLPGDPEVIIQQGLTFASQDKLADAVARLQQAVGMDGENPSAYFWLSYFLLHRRHYRDALQAAESLMVLTPGAMSAYLLRGAALHGLGRHRQAEDDLTRVRAQEPGLLARLSADPVIAALTAPVQTEHALDRMRRSLADTLRSLHQRLNPNG